MHLHDARIQFGGKVGHGWRAVEACRHDHAVGVEPALSALHHEPIAALCQAVHGHSGSHRQIESRRVGLEVVGGFAGGRIRPAWSGEGPARQSVVAGGREQPERVPRPRPPGAADPLVRVQDHERTTMLLEVVAHREASLAAPDHDRVECLAARERLGHHVDCSFLCRHDRPSVIE